MSETHDQSFMKSIFHGVIEEDLIFPYPEPPEDDKEMMVLLKENIGRFFEEQVDSAKIDRDHEIPDKVMNGLKELGLFGLMIPEEYGGLGLSNTAYARVFETVSSYDASIAVTLGAHQSIGLKALLLFGTEDQKKKYLPKLATGEWVAGFALTEPGAGSDAASITTKAELAEDGEGYVLNGSKIWITNGGFAKLFTVFARTTVAGKPKITALIVERDFGVTSGPSEEKMGIRGSSTTTLYFEDVRVPAANVVGEVGRGFKVAMQVLNSGRLSLASGCVGGCKKLIEMTVERTKERNAFGRPIAEFGMIREKVAKMMCMTYALESMTYLTTGLIDQGVKDYSLESAMCKVFGSETYWWVVNECLQVAAGIGYMTEYPHERMLRDARINLIFEGTNEILRAFIALSGMQGPGKELQEVARAIREPIKGFGILSDFVVKRARTALGREQLDRAHPALRKEVVIFEEGTAALARESERVLRKHGREIAEMQFVQKRLAEAAIDLYAIAATISRTTTAIEKKGKAGAKREIQMTAAFAEMADKRIKDHLDNMERTHDELLKEIAKDATDDDGYTYDIY